MSEANKQQIGGQHYKSEIQHWDYAASHNFDYFQGQITKYITRWKKKGGIEDLRKGIHFYQKYLEIVEAKLIKQDDKTPPLQVNKKTEQENPRGYDSQFEQTGKYKFE